MAQAEIPVDLLNPGQVFACLGFLEAAEILLGDAEGGFDWSDGEDVRFRLCAEGDENPFEAVLGFLRRAEVFTTAPKGSQNATGKWRIETEELEANDPFPFPDPGSPATLPCVLSNGADKIVVDHWGDATRRDNVKFWAGAGGYPGAALARDTLGLIRECTELDAANPFAARAAQSSSFRLDWRRDYIPMEVGFSPNEHGDLTMVGFPVVEMLAAIGLTHARPLRINKLAYRYGVVMCDRPQMLLEPMLLRAALGCAPLPFKNRTFALRLGWPGQENQARCVTEVYEELSQ
jgi:CRISPR-associated protein Csb3